MSDLGVTIAGVHFKTPVFPASGCYGYGREFVHLYPLSELGGMVTKGLSTVPWAGNPGQRIVETAAGMINSIGLMNPGIDYFLEKDWPWLKEQGVPVVVNLIGKTEGEYAEVARRLEGSGVAAVEVNISCPNIREGGISFSQSPAASARVVRAVRRATSLPVWVKLSPNVTDVSEFARAIEAEGADALSLINTLQAMAIDIERRRPVMGFTFGGLSGPAVKPVALRMVWQVAGAVQIPVIGLGGIMTAEDAIEFLMAGARAVQVGTACFINPRAPVEIARGIARWLDERGIARVTDIIGAARAKEARQWSGQKSG